MTITGQQASRKTCLGCPYIRRGADPGDIDTLGEPVCTFGGGRQRLFWADLANGTICGHGISPGVYKPWTTGEEQLIVEYREAGGKRWLARISAEILRTPSAIRARLAQLGIAKRKSRRYSREEKARALQAVRAYYRARNDLRALAAEFGVNPSALKHLLYKRTHKVQTRAASRRQQKRWRQQTQSELSKQGRVCLL